jgi:hypothetical protein
MQLNLIKSNFFKKLGVLLYVVNVYPLFPMEVCAIRENVVNVHSVFSYITMMMTVTVLETCQ